VTPSTRRLPRLARSRSGRAHGPARTIRLRLTALYGTVFLVTGAGLLTVGYVFVRSNLRTHHSLRSELLRLGIHPVRGEFGFPPGSPTGKLIHTVENQILGGALHRLLIEYAVALLVITAISVVIGWLLAGRALAPLRKIIATAQRVSGENLGERIALHGPADELKELADTFDRMLARLDGTFASQRHFVANASHELRTPLTLMRTAIDVTLAKPSPTARQLTDMAVRVRGSIDRAEGMIEALLLLAQEGLVQIEPRRGATVRAFDAADLSDLYEVRALIDLAREEPGITVAVDLEAQTVTCGDLRFAFQMDPFERRRLLEGLDDIGLTLEHEAEITEFESHRPAWMPDLARAGAGS